MLHLSLLLNWHNLAHFIPVVVIGEILFPALDSVLSMRTLYRFTGLMKAFVVQFTQ